MTAAYHQLGLAQTKPSRVDFYKYLLSSENRLERECLGRRPCQMVLKVNSKLAVTAFDSHLIAV